MELIIKAFEELSAGELYEILKARTAVFVVEQTCPYQDIDGLDPHAFHVWVEENGELKAYLRVLSKDADTAHIGRVLTTERGRGYGARVLKAGIAVARERLKKSAVYIEAQSYATGFYAREGFRVISDEFLEDGIPHVKMLLKL